MIIFLDLRVILGLLRVGFCSTFMVPFIQYFEEADHTKLL